MVCSCSKVRKQINILQTKLSIEMEVKRQNILKAMLLLFASIDASDILKHVYIDRAICQFNDYYCQNTICKLSFIDRKTKSFSYRCNSTKLLDKVVYRVSLFYRFTGGYKMFLINNLETNYCDFINNSTASQLLTFVRNRLGTFKDGPLAKSCPIPANYSFSNMPIDGQLFPNVFVPSGQYYVSVEVLTNNVRVVLVKVYFEIPAGRTIEDDRMG